MIWDLSNFTIIAKLLFNTTRFYNDIFSAYTSSDVADVLNYIDPNAQFDFDAFASVAPIIETYSNMLNAGIKLIEKNGLVIPPTRKDQND